MRFFYICLLMLTPLAASSQEEAFYIEFKDESIVEAFTKIEATYDVIFSYKDDDISNKRMSLKREKLTIKEVLKSLELLTKLSFKIVNNRYVIINQFLNGNIDVNELDKVIIISYLTKGIEKNNDGSYKISPSKLCIY